MTTRRAAALVALVAVAAPLIAVAAPAKSPRRARPAVADTALVRIGEESWSAAEVERRLNELPEGARARYATPEGRREFLDRLIEERLWYRSARREGVAERADIRAQLEQFERDLVIRTHLNEVMAQLIAPTDSAALAYYEDNADDFRQPAIVTLAHVMSRTEAEAQRVLRAARAGQDWKALAERHSLDSLTRRNGGALGTVTREGIFGSLGPQPALAESAMALGEDRIGGPFRTDRGWHVLRVESVRPEAVRPFDQVRGVILRQLGSRASQDFYQARLAEMRSTLGVHVDSTRLHAFIAQRRSARELFQQAQEGGDPRARIAAYRRVVVEYPESDVSPQAQFMIGFIYSEELRNYDEAEQAFRELLDRYPDSELAESARWMVEHMRTTEMPGGLEARPEPPPAAPAGHGRPERP